MLPAQRNKIDISSLNEEEQKLFRLYGKLPKKDLLQNKLKERKYFDSGDYALSKAGKAPQQSVGTAIPNPEMIPHASTVTSPGLNAVSPPGQQTAPQSIPVNVPGTVSLASRPQVSAFPISGAGSSPGKETSSLGREEHVVNADDAMQD
ncbi:related to IGO2 - protein required for initiation of G0 program [Ustilago sp. UG-2017a]|uniref:mRNA stability protein n=1 Tax=Ustilago bromivora TaxID=307758 RepID=A0A1K0GBD8_9BASI|nr:related to IGO2-protein required for initiation of G0 program [Ustilago bromivora]SOV04025.1 related to IGO2 - protein required for initiation of G0 program [Ustilago sp. UG-2017a]SPC64550.1 related to IGO2 - protein required for initiation of G0 program [Ustilago sp. UG-2017b]SYW84404.1 related to IGO2 - protein required for initiation of G0 program [Ustilago bromivora]